MVCTVQRWSWRVKHRRVGYQRVSPKQYQRVKPWGVLWVALDDKTVRHPARFMAHGLRVSWCCDSNNTIPDLWARNESTRLHRFLVFIDESGPGSSTIAPTMRIGWLFLLRWFSYDNVSPMNSSFNGIQSVEFKFKIRPATCDDFIWVALSMWLFQNDSIQVTLSEWLSSNASTRMDSNAKCWKSTIWKLELRDKPTVWNRLEGGSL